MKMGSFVVAVSVTLTVGLGLGSSDAHAWGPQGSSDMIRERIVPHGFFTLPEPRRFESKRPLIRPRGFVPNTFVGSGATIVGVYAPPISIADPGYYAPMEDPNAVFRAQPAYVQPVNTVLAAPAAPPIPPPSADAQCHRVPDGALRAPGRWHDLAIYLGVDPQSSAAPSGGPSGPWSDVFPSGSGVLR